MKTLSIDVETYSSADLPKCGVYRYTEAEDFEILLFGYSADGGPVSVIDLASGEQLPNEVIAALTDNTVTKWAFNASFERICLSRWLRDHGCFVGYGTPDDTVGNYLDPSSWRCSMVWSAYMGLPLSLEGVGSVLGLEKQKLTEGKELIRYFCQPCAPTKTNGGRTRNLPAHASDKWELFKRYNARDVEVEKSIQKRLSKFPVPDFVWKEYRLDQEINDRGVMIDMELVRQAIAMDTRSRSELTEAMRQLTALENPNSVQQMKQWLSDNGLTVESLGKKDITALLKSAPPELQPVLRLRQQLARSSVKKYQAMQNAVCSDGRCRGMFQFYGANRTGRFSGRLIQMQNLPQNHLPDLEQARALVKAGDHDALRMLYEDVPDTLSQLIRTAFIPRPGYRFIVADFSAIEARVLSWLAGEQWRIDLFNGGGDIYCQCASRMFKVPVEKHGINGHLRTKGKIAELACIAEGQLVLTNRGLVPIEKVSPSDLLWDGQEWIHHDGVISKGEAEVISYEGLTATPDHLVFIEGQQEPVQFGFAASSGAHLIQTGNGRQAVRMGENYRFGKTMDQNVEPLLCPDRMSRVRFDSMAITYESDKWKIKGMSKLLSAESYTKMDGEETVGCKKSLRESELPSVFQLRREGNPLRFFQCDRSRSILDPYFRKSGQKNGDRPDRYEQGLCSGKSTVCGSQDKLCKSAEKCSESFRTEVLALFGKCCDSEAFSGYEAGQDHSGRENSGAREEKKLAFDCRKARLYDIRNAGRHHRFTVSGKLVHNCGYGGSVGALKNMGALEMGLTEDELLPLVTSWRNSNPNIVQFWWDVDTAAMTAVREHIDGDVGNIRFSYKSGMLFITLPSGRRLSYVKPRIGTNQFDSDCLTYEGIGGTKKWERLETYGPKLWENIVQATSRDSLCNAMRTLSHCFITMHIHDELVIEADRNLSLSAVCEQMSRTPPWLPGLELRADGYETAFYCKG